MAEPERPGDLDDPEARFDMSAKPKQSAPPAGDDAEPREDVAAIVGADEEVASLGRVVRT